MQLPPVKMLRESKANDTNSKKLSTTNCWPCFLFNRGKPHGCCIDLTGTTVQSSNVLCLAMLHVSQGCDTKTPNTSPAILGSYQGVISLSITYNLFIT